MSFIQGEQSMGCSGYSSSQAVEHSSGGILGQFYRALEVAPQETGHDWLGLHIWPYLERSENKGVSMEPRAGVAFGDLLTGYCVSGQAEHL